MSADRKHVAFMVVASAISAVASPAAAKTTLKAVMTAGVSASANPFQLPGDPPGGVSLTLGLHPTFGVETAVSTLTIEGDIRADQYIERYGTDVSAAVNANYLHRLTDRTTFRTGAGFRSSSSLLRDRLAGRNGVPAIDLPIDLYLPDPSLVGRRERVNTVEFNAGVSHRAGSRSTFTLDNAFQKSWSNSATVVDLNYYNTRLGYDLAFTDKQSLNLAVQVSRFDYVDRTVGDGYIINPQVGFTTALSATWTASIQGGVSFSRNKLPNGDRDTAKTLSGNARICNRTERESYCLSGARAAQPTLDGRVRSVTSVAVDYQRQMNERDDIVLFGSYNHAGRDLGINSDSSRQYASVGATYSRRFNQRLQGYVSGGVDKAFYSNISSRANYRASIGVRYSIGRL